MRTILIVALTTLLAACGNGSGGRSEAGGTAGACAILPDFVPLYEGARVTTCVRSGSPTPNFVTGTVIYTTDAPGADVIAWYRAQAAEFGLKKNQAGNTPHPMYSARDGEKRSFLVRAEPSAEGATQVTVNWGRQTD